MVDRSHFGTRQLKICFVRNHGVVWVPIVDELEARVGEPRDCWGGEDDVQFDYDNDVTSELAAEELGAMLIHMKMSGVFSARQCCIICFWASRAGVNGVVSDLAMPPNRDSGKYSEQFDSVVGNAPDDIDAYDVPMAVARRFDLSREFSSIPFLPPHEVLAEELIDEASKVTESLRLAKASGKMPLAYTEHPVVLANPDVDVYPLCLYMDGLKYRKHDSIIGVFVYFLHSSRRHLVGTIRKTELCPCGCQGWCSMFGLFSFLRWSFEAMAQRRYPSERHDRKPWHETDSSRKHLAGENLGYCASLLFIKGDWSEFVSSFGFASWATHRAPCFLCRATNLNLHDLEGYSEVGMPHGARTHEEWDIACSVCEIDKDLLPSEVITVRSKLRYKGKKGKARHLIEDVPALGLKKNDRVEPTSSSPDIASIDTAPAGAGFRVRFWRSANERFVRHRNPLFDAGLGITVRSLVADWLHCLSLGVFEVFCAHFMRAIFDTGIWGSDSDPSVQISFARSELTGWYTRESAAGRTYTRVQYMNVYTFGTAKEPQLNLSRAAEVNGFLEFCLYLVVEKSECLGLKASLWRRGLETLVGIFTFGPRP